MILRDFLYGFFHRAHLKQQGQDWLPSAVCPLCKKKTAQFGLANYCQHCGAKFRDGIATPHPETDPTMQTVYPNTGPIAPVATPEQPALSLRTGDLMKLRREIAAERHGAPVSSDTLRLRAIAKYPQK